MSALFPYVTKTGKSASGPVSDVATGKTRMANCGPLAVGPLLIGLHVKAADRVVVQICVISVGHGF